MLTPTVPPQKGPNQAGQGFPGVAKAGSASLCCSCLCSDTSQTHRAVSSPALGVDSNKLVSSQAKPLARLWWIRLLGLLWLGTLN